MISIAGSLEQAALDEALLKAHERNDKPALVTLYARASKLADASGDVDRACFFATHAMVYALEIGDDCAAEMRDYLIHHGRER